MGVGGVAVPRTYVRTQTRVFYVRAGSRGPGPPPIPPGKGGRVGRVSTQHGPVHPGDVDETVASFHGVHSAREIYARYCEVALANQRHPGHITAVGQILVRRGIARRKVAGKIFYSIW